ncbi:MAG: tRNA (guanosine(46)-N7)-methyltransferase TrmB [Malacoplasma sp.]|nr:tRNA (guanosine(46)-N7)-methyltransferase TrmB [Malacoplasma sp.]
MGRLRYDCDAIVKLKASLNYFIDNPNLYKGEWNNKVFENNNPIEIEIGCGKGRFVFLKAIDNPSINFVAIDKSETILVKLLNKIKDYQTPVNNLKIICTNAQELTKVFAEKEVDKIYLNFVDPWPKKRHEKNRLTYYQNLKIILSLLKDAERIEFKTDNIDFFNYSLIELKTNQLNIVSATKDLYESELLANNIATEYEQKWISKGNKINKLILVK